MYFGKLPDGEIWQESFREKRAVPGVHQNGGKHVDSRNVRGRPLRDN